MYILRHAVVMPIALFSLAVVVAAFLASQPVSRRIASFVAKNCAEGRLIRLPPSVCVLSSRRPVLLFMHLPVTRSC